MTEAAYVVDELSSSERPVRLKRLEYVHSVDVWLATTGDTEEQLEGPSSKEMQAAELLVAMLSTADAQGLREQLRHNNDLAEHFSALLTVLSENKATLYAQTPRKRPLKIEPARALGLLNVISEQSVAPPERFERVAKLVGAFFDTRDFKLRLEHPWHGRKVIEGKFDEALAPEIESFVNQFVLASVTAEETRLAVKKSKFKFHLDKLAKPAMYERMELPES